MSALVSLVEAILGFTANALGKAALAPPSAVAHAIGETAEGVGTAVGAVNQGFEASQSNGGLVAATGKAAIGIGVGIAVDALTVAEAVAVATALGIAVTPLGLAALGIAALGVVAGAVAGHPALNQTVFKPEAIRPQAAAAVTCSKA
jgi:hypothetical protein